MADTLLLVGQIHAATDRLHERRAELEAKWAELYIEIGRALEAAARDDELGARAHIAQIAEAEYELCGDCDTFGPLERKEDAAEH